MIQDRFKGAQWYNPGLDIILAGVGNVGSWIGLNLARQAHNLYVYEYDKYEIQNMAGQLIKMSDLGKPKDQVFQSYMLDFADNPNVFLEGKYGEDSMTGNIVIASVDDMAIRKLMFNKWLDYQKSKVDRPKNEINIFLDSRIALESGYIYAVTSMKQALAYQETLYSNEEANEIACNMRACTHTGMLTASYITAILDNHIANKLIDFELRMIPFCIKFDLITMQHDTLFL